MPLVTTNLSPVQTIIVLDRPEQFEHTGLTVQKIRVFPAEETETGEHLAPLRFQFSGAHSTLIPEFHYEDINHEVPASLRGLVLQVVNRYIEQAPVRYTAGNGHKGLGRRLGKGHWE